MACPAELEESLLWKLSALGVAQVAVRHHPDDHQRRWLLAWLPAADWPANERQRLAAALAPLAEPFALSLPPISWSRQDDEDWSESWKRHWQPDPVGQRLLILPAWLALPADHAERLVIRMDPGSAFGTGSHPTTRLCLEGLERLAAEAAVDRPGAAGLEGLRVADLGCGSGILGIAALLLGATQVAAADTDFQAVRATAHNAAACGVDGRLRVRQGSVQDLAELLRGEPADLLLCNILAPVIEGLSSAFASVLSAEGVGLLSGVLVSQEPGLRRALAAQGWTAELVARQSDWALITIRRSGREGPARPEHVA